MAKFPKAVVFLFTLAAMIAADVAAGRAEGELEKIKRADKIRIGVSSDKPPFSYIDEEGLNQGYDVFFARRIARDLLGDESKVEFVLVENNNRMAILQSGEVDMVLANFTVTSERSKQVDFAKPYMKVALGVASPKNAPVTSVAQLGGKKLIVGKGTTADIYFTRRHPEVRLVRYDQNAEAFEALRNGLGAALAHDNILIFAWINNNPDFIAGVDSLGDPGYIAPAVKKGNTDLLQWLNSEIAALSQENFFHSNFETTLRPVFGNKVRPEMVVVESELLR